MLMFNICFPCVWTWKHQISDHWACSFPFMTRCDAQFNILLMEEIRQTTSDGENPVNNVINYQPQLVNTGFLPSTVRSQATMGKAFKPCNHGVRHPGFWRWNEPRTWNRRCFRRISLLRIFLHWGLQTRNPASVTLIPIAQGTCESCAKTVPLVASDIKNRGLSMLHWWMVKLLMVEMDSLIAS